MAKKIINNHQVCVLVPRDRTKATVSKVAPRMGRIVKAKVEFNRSKLSNENVLTDAWRAYKTYEKKKV